jgi:hypothetical protein
MRAWLCVMLLIGAGCGDDSANDCACTVTIGDGTLTLGCGDSGCLGGLRFGCEEDDVIMLGACGVVDAAAAQGSDGDACVPSHAACDPATSICCPRAGVLAEPTCDPVSRQCCVAPGSACISTADCCPNYVCGLVGGNPQCESM